MARLFNKVAEYLTPVLKTSAFEDGVLTPEEFVKAGDELVFKCPTWEWSGGDPASAKSWLPPGKQFLVTRGVPCHRRVAALDCDYAGEASVDVGAGHTGDSEWLEPALPPSAAIEGEIETIGDAPAAGAGASGMPSLLSMVVDNHMAVPSGTPTPPAPMPAPVPAPAPATEPAPADDDDDDDEYADMTTFEEDNLVVADDAALKPEAFPIMRAVEPEDLVLNPRRYDLHIVYDKHYQVPHAYLFGYNERGDPLTPEEVMEDVMQDYANKTVTLEPHPHKPSDGPCASIHPCRHAAVMKRIVAQLGDDATVEKYLFLFLKFLQSVVPTIEYDFTLEVSGGRK